jgi:acetyl esterase
LKAAHPRPAFNDENIAELRPQAAGGMALIDLPVGPLAVDRDAVMPGPGGELALRLFDCRESRPEGPVVVFFHGGGFVIGDLDTHASICAEVTRSLDLPVLEAANTMRARVPRSCRVGQRSPA